MARSDKQVTASGGSSRSIVWPQCRSWSAMTVGIESRLYCSSTMKHRYILGVASGTWAGALLCSRPRRLTERCSGLGAPSPAVSMTSRISVVVFGAEVGDRVFAHHPAQRVLQLHQLNEQIVLGIELRRAHG